jgi:hypothetical protein
MWFQLTMILVFGDNVLTAVAMPAMSPPPPTGTTIASASSHCSTISSPIVPCPLMMWGWWKFVKLMLGDYWREEKLSGEWNMIDVNFHRLTWS